MPLSEPEIQAFVGLVVAVFVFRAMGRVAAAVVRFLFMVATFFALSMVVALIYVVNELCNALTN
jgi:hypothetical protein